MSEKSCLAFHESNTLVGATMRNGLPQLRTPCWTRGSLVRRTSKDHAQLHFASIHPFACQLLEVPSITE
eukprot:3197526-Amphidinium_carterae.1